jgi:hypothetical protein
MDTHLVARALAALAMAACLLCRLPPAGAQDKQEKDLILVVEPHLTGLDKGKVDRAALANLAGSLIAGRGEYKVASHEDIRASLDQTQKAIMLGCTDESCMAEIGTAMGAPYLFYSNVGRVGDTLVLTVSLIENKNVNVLERQSITIKSYDRVVEAMKVATLRLFGEQIEMSPPPDYGVWIWTTLGVGAAMTVLGGLGTGMAYYNRDLADGTSDQLAFNDYRDKVGTWNDVALAGYITGGAFLAASLILFLVEPEDEPIEAGSPATEPAAFHLAPLREGGFVLSGGFRF